MSQQIEFFDIPSPCKRICQTDVKGYCIGCFRSRDERFKWLEMTDQQKREVLRLCRQRALRLYYAKRQQQATITTSQLENQISLFDDS